MESKNACCEEFEWVVMAESESNMAESESKITRELSV